MRADAKNLTACLIFSEILPESRREWLLDKFNFEARRSGRADNYKIWRDENHAIEMCDIDILEKLDYIHNNPVRAGIVEIGEDYLYSSARDYAGLKGLVELEVV